MPEMTPLKKAAVHAVKWTALEQSVQQGLFFLTSVVMARLVSPESYGTISLLHVFTGIAGIFINGGLTAALIQKQDSTRIDESTAFWFNTSVAFIMAATLFVSAPAIAGFYGIPSLESIARAYSLQLILGSLNSVQSSLFAKRLDFKTPMKISSTSMIVSAAIGIYLAWRGLEVWALVAQALSAALIQTILIWRLSPWRPAFVFSSQSFRALFGFGGYLFLAGLLDVIYVRGYALIIGKLYGVRDLGIYNRANHIKQLPATALAGMLSRVAFPVFSRTADDLPRLLRGFRTAIRGVMFLNIPIMLGIATVAHPLVRVLFGPAWDESAPLLEILALAGILWPLHVLNLNVIKALGHSKAFLKVEVIKKATGMTLIVIGSMAGLHGMAWAVVISSIFSFFYNAYYTGKLLGHGAWSQILDIYPMLISGLLMAGAVFWTSTALILPPLPKLIVLVGVGVTAYVVCSHVLKVAELAEAVRIVKVKILRLAGSAKNVP